jgi:hypothetical protein
MITFIICSINPEQCNRLLANISEIAGVEYETIVFDNRNEHWGLCRVYNHCAEKAKYPYLCFIHEDVHIYTENWGKRIVETAEKMPDCGVIGFAGGLQAGKNFSSWWATGKTRVNLCDSFNGKNYLYRRLNYSRHYYSNPYAEQISKVLCVDGLFQFVKKTVLEEIKYDEQLFNGFQFYDVDFSFAVSEKYNNYVLLDFDVFHDSCGQLNREYVMNMFAFQDKWKDKLPKNLNGDRLDGWNSMKLELTDAHYAFMLCLKNHVSLGKYIVQLYRINKLPVFILILLYISIKTVREKISTVIKVFIKFALKMSR